MIAASNLGKKYKKKVAVSDLSFTVELGKVTGFLGPNGSGKSTTMRLMVGLDSGDGQTTFEGKRLQDYDNPASVVGVLLEAKAFHPTRSAYNHLSVLATQGNIDQARVSEVLELVGLSEVAHSKPGKFSLGMSQRLGIAAAILGKPKYLLLDEPANGLDPEGIAWLRAFIKHYASEGNAVFISSHLLSEMAQIADNIVVIGKGKLISSAPIETMLAGSTHNGVYTRTSDTPKLKKLMEEKGLRTEDIESGLKIHGIKSDEVGKIAFDKKIVIYELTNQEASLEEAFLEITASSQEYHTQQETKK